MRSKIFVIVFTGLMVQMTACKKSDFGEYYTDPAKSQTTTVEKQFAGFLYSNKDYVLPRYGNYFVTLRITINRYIQTLGWPNTTSQYVPGIAAINGKWDSYYKMLAQYREFELTFDKLIPDEQSDKRIFMLAATVFLYDQTQQMVDLHGDIPFTTAGRLHQNGGNYTQSFAEYDGAEAIYTEMLDNLKSFANELNTINIDLVKNDFINQDIINGGDLEKWKKYCNSLRLRMLMRVSDVPSFQARVASEVPEIISNQDKYPLVLDNDDNIQMNVYVTSGDVGLFAELQDALEGGGWYANTAGKKMMDFMNATSDPRQRTIFEPGANAGGVFTGVDPMSNESAQVAQVNSGVVAIYNRSTISRNRKVPGALINAAEVNLLLAEIAARAGENATAKTAYEKAIALSVEFWNDIRGLSGDNTTAASPGTPAQVAAYISHPSVSWNAATNLDQRIALLATQKWIHMNILQAYENWAETRRLDGLTFNFWEDNANTQKQPPYRWFYGSSERVYNTANYEKVSAKDNLSTRIFWDVD